jgi:hypothetical protein
MNVIPGVADEILADQLLRQTAHAHPPALGQRVLINSNNVQLIPRFSGGNGHFVGKKLDRFHTFRILGSDHAKNAMWALWGVHLMHRLIVRHGQYRQLGSSGVQPARGLGHGTTFDNQGREDRVAGGFSLERIIQLITIPAWIMEKKFQLNHCAGCWGIGLDVRTTCARLSHRTEAAQETDAGATRRT